MRAELSRRQVEIVALAVKGLSNRQIADKLDIAEGTVKTHLHHALKATGMANRTALVRWWHDSR